MAEVKWIKILTGIFDDEKIKLIDAMPERDAIFVIWIKLLTLAGKVNDNGCIYINADIPYTDEMLATIFNRPVSVVRIALQTFVSFKMIDIETSGKIVISNWSRHQNIEGMDKLRYQNRLRQKRYRDEKTSRNVTSRYSNDLEKIRLDKNREEEREERAPAQTKSKYIDCILLSADQYQSLCERYGKTNTETYMQRLNNYIMSNGKRYKSHYHTLLNWMNRDNVKKPDYENAPDLSKKYEAEI